MNNLDYQRKYRMGVTDIQTFDSVDSAGLNISIQSALS